MKKLTVLLYGIIAYVFFLLTFSYLIGFVGNILVPKSIEGTLSVPLWQAVLTNFGLILLFGLQHSIMARGWFKAGITKYIPEPMERSTYVIFTCIALILIFVFWQPIGGEIWHISNPYITGISYAAFALGWVLVLASSFIINHFDLFGLRQTWLYFKGKPYTPVKFRAPVLYGIVRHPLYLGILLAFWATPIMSFSRLFFAIIFTGYVLKGIQLEERDLINDFGDKYLEYKSKVPKILPNLFRKKPKEYVFNSFFKKEKEA